MNQYARLVYASALVYCTLGALCCETTTADDSQYHLGADSQRQEGVPQGQIHEKTFLQSAVFPGTIRHYSVYVPAQYDGSQPACLMVFQDGHAYQDPNGQFRVPIVYDNLIHKGELPITIVVFVDPGHKKEELPPQRG